MSTTMTVDTKEFQRVAEALFATSSRTFPKFVNGQMFRVATLAVRVTEKANRQLIERQMGVISSSQTLRSGNKGWVRIGKRKLGADLSTVLAARILIARKRATGSFGIKGRNLREMATKLIAFKVRSVGFIKSGWIPAIQKLAPLVGLRGGSLEGAKIVGAPKGYAVPARFTLSGVVTCEIGNTALLHPSQKSAWHGRAGSPMPIAEKGLRVAMDLTTRDMADEFYKRMAIDLKPFGGRLGP